MTGPLSAANAMPQAPLDGLPVVEQLRPAPEAEDVFLRLAALPNCVFFDSALRDPVLGRYSFVTADPWQMWQLPVDGPDALATVLPVLERFSTPSAAELPPFQGGLAGVFGYELGRQLERIAAAEHDEFESPALAAGLYDVVVAFDHVAGQAWLVSQGFPETEPGARRRRARLRLAEFRRWLRRPPGAAWRASHLPPPVDRMQLAPQFRIPGPAELTSNFARDQYLAAVRRAIDYIVCGDVFQVNLAQRLLMPALDDPVSLYLRLRRRNPAPFAGYFNLGGWQVVSASPERFIQVRGREVETRPIKGTRPRALGPEADLFSADDLRQSGKDRAENVMIVDLLRNDLSRVCRSDSVHVSQLCRLETYQFVQHLVSVVRGTLPPEVGPLDLLRAAFPGGSVTGAPKIRAMQIIAELEPTARGPYCGGLGYVGFDGSMDTSILIRTIVAGRGWWQAPVGGGIVAQSDPSREYEETWHKAEGLLRAMQL